MGIQKKDREYERFLDQISDFIFVEDKPERADIIFVPGNGNWFDTQKGRKEVLGEVEKCGEQLQRIFCREADSWSI